MSMAFGKPIVGVLGGDGKDILLESGGAVIAEENPQSIADAINHLASLSSEERKKLGQLNQAYYFSNLSIKRCGDKVNSYLTNCVKKDWMLLETDSNE